MGSKKIVVRAEQLYTGKERMAGRTIIIEGNRIVDILPKAIQADFTGIVTPAFIDAHSHIGMERQGEPIAESEVDDTFNTFAPLQNPVNSIYFDDRAFAEAVDFGVLYSCVVPGSGNLLGGQAVVIRNFSETCASSVVSQYGYKMALGYNPRAASGWKGQQHNTRMGNAAFLEKQFNDVIRQETLARIKRDQARLKLDQEQKQALLSPRDKHLQASWIDLEYKNALSEEQWAVVEMLKGEKIIKVHVHKADDALFLIDLKKKFNLNLTAEHACGIADKEIFNELADNNIPIVYGPLDSFDYKVELKTASYKNAAALMKSRARFGLMTDHPVILAHHLRESLKYFLINGMTQEMAISLITHENARILKLSDRLGTIEPGMLASLIVWNTDPFHLSAFPRAVIAEGRTIRQQM